VLGTYRDDEVGPYLARTLDTLIRGRLVHHIRLGRLPEHDVAGMVGALAGGQEPPRQVVDVLYSETQGNPFFVEEVFRHLVEEGRLFDEHGRFHTGVVLGELDVPDNVRLVIGRRFDRLTEGARRVLSTAAVAGRYFDYGLIERCAGDDVVLDALDEAERARLVAPVPGDATGDRFGFVHELVRQTLLTQLSTARRRHLHLAVADAVDQALGGHDRASDLAHHLVASAPLGGGIRTATACLAAGDRAISALAGAEAIEWYEQGLLFATRDVELQTDLLTGLGEAQRRTGHSQWRQTLLDASHLATEQRDAARLVRAVLANNRGITSVIGHVDDERLQFLATALALVGPAPTSDRAELLALQAVELVFAGDHGRVLQAADEAAVIAAGLEDVAVRARVGVRRLWACLVPDRFHAMASEGGDVVGLSDATGDLQLRVWSRVVWAWALLPTGDLDEARRQTAEAMIIADESGQPGLRSVTHSAHGAALDALGDHEEDARLTQVALELGQEASWPDALAWYGARMWLHWSFGGQNEIAAEVMAQSFAEYPQMITWQGGWALELGLIGRSEELAGVLTTLPAVLPRVPVDIFWVNTHFYFAMAQGYGVENTKVAGAIYEALFPYRSLHVAFGIGYWGPVELGLAVAARVMGDVDVALAHHEAASATIDACGATRARALNGYQWAVTLLARDAPTDRQRATEILQDTLAYCQSRGYLTYERKARQLLSTLTLV
jgi:tetratricopeptide (TPR) repeat protein